MNRLFSILFRPNRTQS